MADPVQDSSLHISQLAIDRIKLGKQCGQMCIDGIGPCASDQVCAHRVDGLAQERQDGIKIAPVADHIFQEADVLFDHA